MKAFELQSERSRKIPKSWWWAAIAGAVLCGLLPVAGSWWRRGRRARCELDGQVIEPLFLVRITDRQGRVRRFCCLTCAELWLRRKGRAVREILVTDESSAQLIDASAAYYVSSDVYSNAPTGDRRHVFLAREQAAAHAEAFRGRILLAQERPFVEVLPETSALRPRPVTSRD